MKNNYSFKKQKKTCIFLMLLFCGLFVNTAMAQKNISWSASASDNNWATAGNWNYTSPAVSFAATNISGSDTITLTAANSEISVGDVVSGTGVPIGATILTIDGSLTIITISAVTTANVTSVSFTFAIPKPGAIAQVANNTDFTYLTSDIIYNVESANTYYQRRIQNLTTSLADMTLSGTGTLVIDVNQDQFYTFGGYAIMHQSTNGTKFTVDCNVKLNNTFTTTATNRNNVLRCSGNAANILEFGPNSVLENIGNGPMVSSPISGTVLMNGVIKGLSTFTCGVGNTTFGPTSNNPLFTAATNQMNLVAGANVVVNTTAGNTFYKNTLGQLRFNNFAAKASATITMNTANVWNSPLYVNTLSIDRLTGANLILNADQTVNAGTVTLLVATSVLNLTVGAGVSVTFGDSAAATWLGGSVLNIYGFDTATSIKFGTTSGGLTTTQLSQICLKDGVNAGKAVKLDANGKLIVDTATITWSGGTSNVYNNVANWVGGVLPSANSNVVIPAPVGANFNPVMASNGNMYSLTVLAGATLTVNVGFILNVSGKIDNAGTINVFGNAHIIQRFTVPNTGDVRVYRRSSTINRLDYTMWSSPVTGTQTLQQFSPLTLANRFYTYDNTLGTVGLYSAVADPTTTTFATGSGYLIRMPNTDVTAGYDAGTTAIAITGIFLGVPNNGTYSLTGLTPDKFYAIGNPYPSPLNGTTFLNNNSTGGTLYFWRKTNGVANSNSAYATLTTLGGTAAGIVAPNNNVPTAVIQTGQGFIVKTGATATSLNFHNGMRSNSILNTYFFKTKQGTEPDRLWLNLTSNAGAFSQTLIGYLDGATLDIDNGFDGEYINDSPIALTSNINNGEYTIQARPTFDPTDVVALNFKTDVAGDYTIAKDHVDGLFSAGQDIYLVDKTTGTETNLQTDAYTFTAAAGVDNARFSLKYQKTLGVNAVAFNDNSVRVYRNNGILTVISGANAISNIKVFDIQGRLLVEQKNVNATSVTIKNLRATQQVVLVKVTGADNTVVTKKVIN